jgi:hypothetical protein
LSFFNFACENLVRFWKQEDATCFIVAKKIIEEGFLPLPESPWHLRDGPVATEPPPSRMSATLKAFDPSQRILKGDLNFINWEAGVGTRCNSYFNVDFAFLTRPEAIKEAFEHGFNLFGMANNHSEDCSSGVDPSRSRIGSALSQPVNLGSPPCFRT